MSAAVLVAASQEVENTMDGTEMGRKDGRKVKLRLFGRAHTIPWNTFQGSSTSWWLHCEKWSWRSCACSLRSRTARRCDPRPPSPSACHQTDSTRSVQQHPRANPRKMDNVKLQVKPILPTACPSCRASFLSKFFPVQLNSSPSITVSMKEGIQCTPGRWSQIAVAE